MTRMFLAVVPPEEVVEDLDEFWAVRRDAGARVGTLRWTTPAQWHLTLAFLPSVPDRALETLVEHVTAAVASCTPFVARVSGGGAFPDAAHARVLWAGVEVRPPDPLERLARRVRTAVTTAGVETPRQPFRAHLTLARSGRPFEATRWIRVLDTYRGPSFAVQEIQLIASHPGPAGKRRRHEQWQAFGLANTKGTDAVAEHP